MTSRRFDSVCLTHHFHKTLSRLAVLWVVLLAFFSGDVRGALIGNYEFRGNFDNSVSDPGHLPGVIATATGESGFSGRGWYWDGSDGASGLTIPTLSVSETYSIGIEFRFSEVSAYRKVLDFADRTQDAGLYIHGSQFTFYPVSTSAGTASADTLLSIILTRDSDGQMHLYQKGSLTPILSFIDSNNDFEIQSQLHFFLDDIRQSGEYSRAGSVSLIRVWDTALTEEEVVIAFEAIPEPSLLHLLGGVGAIAFAFRHISRRRQS